MTPQDFQNSVGGWITALSSLVAPVTVLVGAVLGIVAFAKSRLNEIRINSHSETIKQVLRDMPSAGQSGGVQINAQPPSEINVTNDAAPAQTPVPNQLTEAKADMLKDAGTGEMP